MPRKASASGNVGATKLLTAPFTPQEVEQIDDVRFASRHGSRAETIRFLIKKGLEAVANANAGS